MHWDYVWAYSPDVKHVNGIVETYDRKIWYPKLSRKDKQLDKESDKEPDKESDKESDKQQRVIS